MILAIAGCSVNLRQLDTINQIRSSNDDPLAGAGWAAQWNGEQFTLYAVALPDQTIFGYEKRLLVYFNGWNITEVVGILPNGDHARIEMQEDKLLYFVNDRLLDSHDCAAWIGEMTVMGAMEYRQACSGREPYVNEIDVDSDGLITRLEFLIHPEFPPLIMTPLNKDNSNE